MSAPRTQPPRPRRRRALPLAGMLALATGALATSAAPASDIDWGQAATSVLKKTEADYRWFHRHPELSEQEEETAAHLAGALRSLGMEVHPGIGGHGLVGLLRGKKAGKGPVVLYRADLDGLPVVEKTGVPFASENAGVMHACGHDVHMAVALGVLRVLKAHDDEWAGTVLFVGQPAEELGKGARAMLGDRKLRRLLRRVGKPRLALALHDTPNLAAGKVALHPGFAYANVDSVDIVVHGRGGHGAQPQEAIDPVVMASQMVLGFQTIVSRRIKGSEPAVITVGSFHAGKKHNIIPPKAELKLTVRSYSPKTRKTLLDEIERVARGVAEAHGAPQPPEVTVLDEHTPALFNDPEWTAHLRSALQDELGEGRVLDHEPSLGGEDFGQFSRLLKIPGVIMKLGAADPRALARGEPVPGLHSDRYVPEVRPTLKTGIEAMGRAVFTGLTSPP